MPKHPSIAEFQESLKHSVPPTNLPAPIEALWWDAKRDWSKAHTLVDDLETQQAMAVHAYLHRKEGEQWNADYWYRKAGKAFYRNDLDSEWQALLEGLLESDRSA